MSIQIPDDIVQATRMSEEQLRLEFAVLLFRLERLTLGQAGKLAGMPVGDLMTELVRRQVPLHYDVASFDEDLRTLEQLHRS